MHSYQFIFSCGKCAKEITELVVSPEVLTREELNELQFRLRCKDPDCGWTGERTGFDAEKTKAALNLTSVCG
jgi:hypothetical protein